jgi:preprotein translocase subunit SecG
MILALWYHGILATLFGFAALALIGVILLQRGKGVGLSGAFGGAGGHTAFGAKTGDVLTWITIIGAIVVLGGAVVLNYIFVPFTPFATTATPPTPAVPTVPAEGTSAPVPSGTPVESAAPTPSETTPPADTESPGETTAPGGGAPEGDAPEGSWNPAERADRPTYARHDIFGENLG